MKPKHIFRILLFTVLFCFQFNLSAQNNTQITTFNEFNIKGFHLDLRIQVMTPKALQEFADTLSSFGINTLVLEWEGTFPFEKHATISNEFSYTKDEITSFIAHCKSIGIQVIPLQQTLGHVEYILRHPRYTNLKEDKKDISQLCPMEVLDNRALFTSLFTELASMHDSDYIHIGGDETNLLGHCEKCKAKVSEESTSKLFVDHMKMITNIVISLGKKPVMWADIILKHPEAAHELPKETIFIDWNYGWKINYFGDIPNLQHMGFTFWGAPAIRSHPDNWYVTDWTTHFNNQRDFIPYARQSDYKGIIMTSWSTTGLYGFTWDVGYDVMDMVQIRNTYPLSGFRILIASYAEALSTKTPINPETFVLKYGKDRFGLSTEEAHTLWQFLSQKPELVANGKLLDAAYIAKTKAAYNIAKSKLLKIEPLKNESEFNHLKLMAEFRIQYLNFKEVEAAYNAETYRPSQNPELVKQLDKILEKAKTLDKKFIALNKDFLYDAELNEQNAIRVQAVKGLRDRLTKLK
ncbi:family 20 glycosylhydrolase [Formosa sediminum]|uniref:Family 20 glycosylhydrolase n=1 Tax=Formosa sediminum TaxID=2594004 RepID=A0A516GUL3_9FLAO|nr:family 20 glycosylhydrolase [Formosa sediminum]QDO95185.1 family 20 glycosylhydrolase [Formosa sediminum]